MTSKHEYYEAPSDIEEALDHILSGNVEEVSLDDLIKSSDRLSKREKITISLDSRSVQAYRDYAAARGLNTSHSLTRW
jgi:hypothetical protein